MRWQVLFEIVLMASMFTFLSVFWWALQRRRERESQLRYDLARRLLERDAVDERGQALDWLRDQEGAEQRRRREGTALAAMIAIAVGAGALIAMRELSGEDTIPAWVSLLVGVALLLHLALTRRRGPPAAPPPA